MTTTTADDGRRLPQNIVFKYLGQTVKTVGIGPNDIVDENHTLILGLIWSMIVFFLATDLEPVEAAAADAGGEKPKPKKKSKGNELKAFKGKVKGWVQAHVEGYDGVEIKDLTHSFADGKAFLAIVNSADPEAIAYEPSDDPIENFHNAFEAAETAFGVPQLLDANDAECWDDEQSMITYLGEARSSRFCFLLLSSPLVRVGFVGWSKPCYERGMAGEPPRVVGRVFSLPLLVLVVVGSRWLI